MSGKWAGRRVYSRDFHRNKNIVRRRSGGRCEVLGDRPEVPWGQRSLTWARCVRTARSCDHVIPQWRGGGDELANLQDICDEHHKTKTRQEAAAGIALRKGRAKRPAQRHPGLRRDSEMAKVQLTQAISGQERGSVLDLPDGDAEFLIQGGYAQEYEGSAGEGDVEELEFEPEDHGDPELRADRHTGKHATDAADIEGQPEPVHVEAQQRNPFDVDTNNPFADSNEDGDPLDSMKLAELRGYLEYLNENNDEAQLPTSGNKAELQQRIRDAQRDHAEWFEAEEN